jgi:hypothetical protein
MPFIPCLPSAIVAEQNLAFLAFRHEFLVTS